MIYSTYIYDIAAVLDAMDSTTNGQRSTTTTIKTTIKKSTTTTTQIIPTTTFTETTSTIIPTMKYPAESDLLLKKRLRHKLNSRSKSLQLSEQQRIADAPTDFGYKLNDKAVATPVGKSVKTPRKVQPLTRAERAGSESYKDVMWGKVRTYHETPKVIKSPETTEQTDDMREMNESSTEIDDVTRINILKAIQTSASHYTPRHMHQTQPVQNITNAFIPVPTTLHKQEVGTNKIPDATHTTTTPTEERTVLSTTTTPKTSTYRSQWATENYHVEEKLTIRERAEKIPSTANSPNKDFLVYDFNETLVSEDDYWIKAGMLTYMFLQQFRDCVQILFTEDHEQWSTTVLLTSPRR